MLSIRDVDFYYGKAQALFDINMEINEGEIISIIGANGAGKTTLLKCICGINRIKNGTIMFDNEDISHLKPHKIVEKGITMVPEARHVFPDQTILENLIIGAYTRTLAKREMDSEIEKVYAYLPVLKEKRNQLAGTLSGGEQQMLAIGRGLMANPRILLLDEPSLGLSPLLVETVIDIINKIYEEIKLTIILVEQNANVALDISKKAFVLQVGHKVMEGDSERIKNDENVARTYLGG